MIQIRTMKDELVTERLQPVQAAVFTNNAMHLVIFGKQPFGQIRTILPGDAGDEGTTHGQETTLMRPSRCAFSNSMSASTMSLASSLKVVFGFQPNCRSALLLSPTSISTSAGRR